MPSGPEHADVGSRHSPTLTPLGAAQHLPWRDLDVLAKVSRQLNQRHMQRVGAAATPRKPGPASRDSSPSTPRRMDDAAAEGAPPRGVRRSQCGLLTASSTARAYACACSRIIRRCALGPTVTRLRSGPMPKPVQCEAVFPCWPTRPRPRCAARFVWQPALGRGTRATSLRGADSGVVQREPDGLPDLRADAGDDAPVVREGLHDVQPAPVLPQRLRVGGRRKPGTVVVD
jgi:hypothetical protein